MHGRTGASCTPGGVACKNAIAVHEKLKYKSGAVAPCGKMGVPMSDDRFVEKSVSKLHRDNVLTLGEVFGNVMAQVKRALVKRRKGRGEHVVPNTATVYIKDVKTKAEYKALCTLGLFIKRKALAKLDRRCFYTDGKATLAKSYPFCFFCKGVHKR